MRATCRGSDPRRLPLCLRCCCDDRVIQYVQSSKRHRLCDERLWSLIVTSSQRIRPDIMWIVVLVKLSLLSRACIDEVWCVDCRLLSSLVVKLNRLWIGVGGSSSFSFNRLYNKMLSGKCLPSAEGSFLVLIHWSIEQMRNVKCMLQQTMHEWNTKRKV